MKLTALKIEQLPIVIDLTKKIWPVAYGEILSKAQLDYMIDKFYNETALRELIQKGHVFYLAQDDNEKYVGFVSYELNSEPNKTKIHKIYVLPETQGTGLGRQFFELVKEKAIEIIKKYLEDSFEISPGVILDEDITFSWYNNFAFLGYSFTFNGLATDSSFKINGIYHLSWVNAYKMCEKVNKFKAERNDSKH